jgi:hypothetical protein
MQTYATLLDISKRVNWRIDDIVGRFDFSKPFLPETFARTGRLSFLSPEERLTLNHVRARGYVALFELVENFVEAFVLKESTVESSDASRGAALEHFAREETKHMELFRRVLKDFDDDFGVACGLIGPAEDIKAAVLAHDPLGVVILTLHLEWMSQGHYLESVKDDEALDPQFKSLLRHHWMEECQHARLDGLMLAEMAAGKSAELVEHGVREYLGMVKFLDGGFRGQAGLDLASFELAADRVLAEDERESFLAVQHQALRWTFLGSAMQNRNFLGVLDGLGDNVAGRVREAAAMYG